MNENELLVRVERGRIPIGTVRNAEVLVPEAPASKIERGNVARGEDGVHAATIRGDRRCGVARVLHDIQFRRRDRRHRRNVTRPEQLAAVGIEAVDVPGIRVRSGEKYPILPDDRRISTGHGNRGLPENPRPRRTVPLGRHVGVCADARAAEPSEAMPLEALVLHRRKGRPGILRLREFDPSAQPDCSHPQRQSHQTARHGPAGVSSLADLRFGALRHVLRPGRLCPQIVRDLARDQQDHHAAEQHERRPSSEIQPPDPVLPYSQIELSDLGQELLVLRIGLNLKFHLRQFVLARRPRDSGPDEIHHQQQREDAGKSGSHNRGVARRQVPGTCLARTNSLCRLRHRFSVTTFSLVFNRSCSLGQYW